MSVVLRQQILLKISVLTIGITSIMAYMEKPNTVRLGQVYLRGFKDITLLFGLFILSVLSQFDFCFIC